MLKLSRRLSNEKGMAALEMVPLLIITVLVINFSLGFFGAIHSGILNSIAARNYAFETFRHRSNVTYFRQLGGEKFDYVSMGSRLHATTSELKMGNNFKDFFATSRPIDFFDFQPERQAELVGNANDHNTKTRNIAAVGERSTVAVNPIWIKTAYGICLNLKCGDGE
ncbi:MAG: hypothetical protein ACOYOK_05860 [Pseudobdellovibrionaceae bacterium]